MADLYLVATPIGNLEDITLRALRILKEVDVIACEDTSHSAILLAKYDIKKPLISYWKARENQGAENIIEKLDLGNNVAVITDAGMPCISDPGSVVVRKARQAGHNVYVVPGACACVSAVALSGYEGGFSFVGFLPEKNKDRKNVLLSQVNNPLSSVFYIAPHDYKKDIQDIIDVFGERRATVAREMTKLHEEVVESSLTELLQREPIGEYVLVVKGKENTAELNELSLNDHLTYYKNLGYDKKEIIKLVAQERGISKNEVYQVAIELFK